MVLKVMIRMIGAEGGDEDDCVVLKVEIRMIVWC